MFLMKNGFLVLFKHKQQGYEETRESLEFENGELNTLISNEFVTSLKITVDMKLVEKKVLEKNFFKLSKEELETRVVKFVDISKETPKEMKEEAIPSKVKLEKFNVNLGEDWLKKSENLTIVYVITKIDIPIWGIQTKAEDYASEEQGGNLIRDLCKVYSLADEWKDYELNDLRELIKTAYKTKMVPSEKSN
jgi:hypothetical protein